MTSARAIAKAIARWVWDRRGIRVQDERFELKWLLLQLKHVDRHYEYSNRERSQAYIEESHIHLVWLFFKSFESMKNRYDAKRRWWRQQNLLAEEKMSGWGEGLIHEWTEIIRKIQEPPKMKVVPPGIKKSR